MSVLEVNPDTVATELPVIINELLQGAGVVVIRSSLSPDDLAESRDLIMQYSAMEGDKITHFHGGHEDQVHLQRRVWNLLNKGEVFERMVQHPTVMKIAGAFLGSEFIMGSVAANRLLPGGPGQEPHVDYPYWDLYRTETFPANINSSFPLNMQATFLLDDFTEENGATAFLPGSQQTLSWPDEATFYAGRSARSARPVTATSSTAWCGTAPCRTRATATGQRFSSSTSRNSSPHSRIRNTACGPTSSNGPRRCCASS